LLECIDEDECAGGTVTCSGPTQCVNIIGSFFCGCNIGYTTDAECTDCINDNMAFGDDSPSDLCVAESDGTCCENIDECDGININLCPVLSSKILKYFENFEQKTMEKISKFLKKIGKFLKGRNFFFNFFLKI